MHDSIDVLRHGARRIILAYGLGICRSVAAKRVPTSVRPTQGGLLITGDWGDPLGCGKSNYLLFPTQTDPGKTTTDQFLSIATTALAANKGLMLYVDQCVSVPWWFGDAQNVNKINPSGVILYKD